MNIVLSLLKICEHSKRIPFHTRLSMVAFQTGISLLLLLVQPGLAQPAELKQQLAAMELTLFAETFCKDTPIKRIMRLEENFLDASKQKEKDLPTRINDLMERIKPTKELLEKPDPCESDKYKKNERGLLEKFTGHQKESDYVESYNYPVIKWKAIQIPEMEDTVAQLTTNFDAPRKGNGKLKYQLLIKAQQVPRFLYITLLDKNGFKLNGFSVQGNYFRETGTPNYWEANESLIFTERDYKQARGYTINLR